METFQTVRDQLDCLVQKSHIPGLQLVVVNADQILFDYAGGWADLGCLRPMNATTTMMAYSMSKTVTAAAVLQLVESHNLCLDDPIDRYVDFCPYGSGVTLRRLLAHTAGIPNPLPLAWVHTPDEHVTFNEHNTLMAVLHRHHQLSFSPGTRYRYSNIGYWLLGAFVECQSGEKFSSYVAEHVLRPSGITQKEMGYSIIDDTNHARGYLEKYSLLNAFKRFLINRKFIGPYHDRWLEIYPHYVNGPAYGGLVGTAQGFAKILQDQLKPRSLLFSGLTQRHYFEAQQTCNGSPVPASLGWNIGALNGARHYFKEGGGGGFHCMMRLYPSDGIGTVVMTNATGFDVDQLLNRVHGAFSNITK